MVLNRILYYIYNTNFKTARGPIHLCIHVYLISKFNLCCNYIIFLRLK